MTEALTPASSASSRLRQQGAGRKLRRRRRARAGAPASSFRGGGAAEPHADPRRLWRAAARVVKRHAQDEAARRERPARRPVDELDERLRQRRHIGLADERFQVGVLARPLLPRRPDDADRLARAERRDDEIAGPQREARRACGRNRRCRPRPASARRRSSRHHDHALRSVPVTRAGAASLERPNAPRNCLQFCRSSMKPSLSTCVGYGWDQAAKADEVTDRSASFDRRQSAGFEEKDARR